MLPDPARRVSIFGVSGLAAAVALAAIAGPADAATHVVNAGGDLQAALNAAQPGDEIVLEAGARFVGSFELPPKPSGPVITIRSSATLPARRIGPGDAALLPKIASPTVEPAFTVHNTTNWRIDGVQFESTKDGMYNIIYLQDAVNIVLDRILIIGGSQGQRRAVLGNGQQVTLTRSHIANIWRVGEESQAFAAWDGAGPYTITDNYLEAASENILFGGAASASSSRIPADILVENNHMTKRLDWKGQPRVVKNLFELKSAKRVVIRNNLMEHNWTDGQTGYAVLFTVRSDSGGWATIEDVTFEHNIVRHTEQGINILGRDPGSTGQATRITIRNNLLVCSGNSLMIGDNPGLVVLDHNTIVNGGTFALLYGGKTDDLRITNTLGYHSAYGVFGDGGTIGTSALQTYAKSYTWTHNALAGESGWGYSYPAVTWQPSLADHNAQFNADYTLKSGSVYKNAATDGSDAGRLWDATTTTTPTTEPLPSEPLPSEPPPSEPPPSDPPADTTGPVVTVSNVVQNPNFYKFRVNATDASGIAAVKVVFAGSVVASSTTVPLDVSILLRKLAKGTYPLQISVTDTVGNATVMDRTVVK